MMTADQIIEAMQRLPDDELKKLRARLDEIDRAKRAEPVRRGDRIRALAGSAHVGRVLDPNPSRESIYEDRD